MQLRNWGRNAEAQRPQGDTGHRQHAGLPLKTFTHHRLKGHEHFRLRVGDYRIIYTFDAERNVIHLLAVGNRREIYRDY